MRRELTLDVDVATAGVTVFVAENYGSIGVGDDKIKGAAQDRLKETMDIFIGNQYAKADIIPHTLSDYSAIDWELTEFIYDENMEAQYDDYIDSENFDALNSAENFLNEIHMRRAAIELAAEALL